MGDDRANQAIERIERALGRIETAAQRALAAPAPLAAPPAPGNDEELQALREVHRTLQEKVAGAVAQLDRMLAARSS
jgi:hypothetical protein